MTGQAVSHDEFLEVTPLPEPYVLRKRRLNAWLIAQGDQRQLDDGSY
jgi:hypothetical protein